MNEDNGELPASARVFLNPELLSKIFHYVDIKTIEFCRRTCHKWRFITDWHMRRHLQKCLEQVNWFGAWLDLRGLTSYECYLRREREADEAAVMVKCKDNPLETLNTDFENHLFINGCYNCRNVSKLAEKTRAVRDGPVPLVTSRLVNCVWTLKITHLHLSHCMTIDDWNAAGAHIVGKMQHLEGIKVDLEALRNYVLPLCYLEMIAEEVKENKNLTKATIRYTTAGLDGFLDEHQDFRPCSINLEFMRYCPNLDGISFKHQERVVKHYMFNTEDGFMLFGRKREGWECVVDVGKVAFKNRLKHAEKFAPLIETDVKYFLGEALPKKLTIGVVTNLLATMPCSATVNLEQLTLRQEYCCCFCSIRVPTENVLITLARNEAFKGLKRLSLVFEGPGDLTSCEEKSLEAPKTSSLTSVATLHLSTWLNPVDSKHWTLAQKLMPNVTLLIFGFCSVRERTEALKLLPRFKKLRQVVIYDCRQRSELDKRRLDNAAMAAPCLKGLLAFAFIFDSSEHLIQHSPVLVKACEKAKTIRKLHLFYKQACFKHDELLEFELLLACDTTGFRFQPSFQIQIRRYDPIKEDERISGNNLWVDPSPYITCQEVTSPHKIGAENYNFVKCSRNDIVVE